MQQLQTSEQHGVFLACGYSCLFTHFLTVLSGFDMRISVSLTEKGLK